MDIEDGPVMELLDNSSNRDGMTILTGPAGDRKSEYLAKHAGRLSEQGKTVLVIDFKNAGHVHLMGTATLIESPNSEDVHRMIGTLDRGTHVLIDGVEFMPGNPLDDAIALGLSSQTARIDRVAKSRGIAVIATVQRKFMRAVFPEGGLDMVWTGGGMDSLEDED